MSNYGSVTSHNLLISLCLFFPASLMAASEVHLQELPSPAIENSKLSRLTSDEQGNLYLSWVTESGDSASLFYSQLTERGWSDPQAISSGSNWFVNWADFPALSVNEGNKAALWLRMSAEGTYDYDIDSRFYAAASNEWSNTATLHKDGVSAEHGFVAMLPLSGGSTLISWLDGRNTKVANGYGEMTLRAGIFNSRGATVQEWEVDARVCDCCQTSAALTEKGPIIVYRDRSSEEIRDIYSARYDSGAWTTPKPVYSDNWQIAGCPVNGPAVVADGSFVAVSWFTAKDDLAKVQLAVSDDSGDKFSEPVLVAAEGTIGRVDTAILKSGGIVVSWLDTSEEHAKIMLSHYDRDLQLLDRTEVATTSASRRSGFPIIEAIADSVYITWTDITDTPSVKIARADYSMER
ncbi:MAG: hypothetical protein OXU30_15750 [Gammaproteobacteria bacterium]|nr:hypothetical protein [Gammaproteobacteria bacterium]MDD9895928.1 hypothetical protein [Gammaproteobacteria bacterium]